MSVPRFVRMEQPGVEALCTGEASREGERQAQAFAALLEMFAVPTRLKMLVAIARAGESGLTVGDIVKLLDAQQPTVSQHLLKMLATGIVDVRPAGKHNFYTINRGVVDYVTDALGAVLRAPESVAQG